MGDMIRDILAVANAFAQFKLGQKQLSDYEEKRRQEALQAVWERQQQERNLALQGERVGLERERFDLSRQQTEEDQKRYMTKIQMQHEQNIRNLADTAEEKRLKADEPRQELLKEWADVAPKAGLYLWNNPPKTDRERELHQQAQQVLWGAEARQQKSLPELQQGLGQLKAIMETLQGEELPDELLEDAATIVGAVTPIIDQLPEQAQEAVRLLGEPGLSELPPTQIHELLGKLASFSGGLIDQTAAGRYRVKPAKYQDLLLAAQKTPSAIIDANAEAALPVMIAQYEWIKRTFPKVDPGGQRYRDELDALISDPNADPREVAAQLYQTINERWRQINGTTPWTFDTAKGTYSHIPTQAQALAVVRGQLLPQQVAQGQARIELSGERADISRGSLAERRRHALSMEEIARQVEARRAATPARSGRAATSKPAPHDIWDVVGGW